MGAHRNTGWLPAQGVSIPSGVPSTWMLLTVTTGTGHLIHANTSSNEIHEVIVSPFNGNAGAQVLNINVIGAIPAIAEFSVSYAANTAAADQKFILLPGQSLGLRPTTGSVFRINAILIKHVYV